MKSLRASLFVPLFGLFVAMGCTAQAADGTGSSNGAVSDESADGASSAALPRRPPGPEMLLFAAMHESIGLSDAQKTTIQSLIDGLAPKAPSSDVQAWMATVAAAVRANGVDVATLEASKPAAPDPSARRAAVATAIGSLHDTLTHDQRSALVAAIEAHAKDAPSAPPPPPATGEAGSPPPPSEGAPAGGFGPPPGDPLHALLAGLDLSSDQASAIKAKLDALKPAAPGDGSALRTPPDPAAMKAHLETFVDDSFDATAFVTPPEGAPAPPVGDPADRMLNALAAITPLLTDAQRETLASRIEKPAAPPSP